MTVRLNLEEAGGLWHVYEAGFRLQLPKGIVRLNLIALVVLLHCLVAVLDEVMHWWYPVFCSAAALRKYALTFLKKRLKGKEKKIPNFPAE